MSIAEDPNQRGSAIVIAVFILVLISVFVAAALSRNASEAMAVGNETAEGRAFYAAQGSLEMMTRNFNKVFEVRLNPRDGHFDPVRNGAVPRLGDPLIGKFTFVQEVDRTSENTVAVLQEGPFTGLSATRDNWRLRTTATDPNGTEVELTRNILNNRIPIFQFGIFYNDNLEFHPGPRFDFGGRVHSNGSLFLMAIEGLHFSSRVSSAKEIITDVARNGRPWSQWGDEVYIRNGSANPRVRSNMGSVLSTPANGTPIFHNTNPDPEIRRFYDPDMPILYTNANWNPAAFGENLLSRQPELDLPLKIASARDNNTLDYVELVKRGKAVGDLHKTGGTPSAPVISAVTAATADTEVTASERYANKTGIRISLSNSKARLPGCATAAGTATTDMCGVRLDGASARPTAPANWAETDSDTFASRGYQPLPMIGGYRATRLNGERFRTSAGQVWIKIELVRKDDTTNAIVTQDVTEDILSLGVTEPAPCIPDRFAISSSPDYYNGTCTATGTRQPFVDSRSIIKLQRFVVPGENFIGTDTISQAYMTNFAGWSSAHNSHTVVYEDCPTGGGACTIFDRMSAAETAHKKTAVVGAPEANKVRRVVPFPIKMFDSREGVYNANNTILDTTAVYGNRVPWAGVMSLIDVDINNLRRFLGGEFDNFMPTGTKYHSETGHVLRNHPTNPALNDIPQDNGWVIYISDRRGDHDFDGEYDMEDIYGNNDGTLQRGENVNNSVISVTAPLHNGLDTNYWSLSNLTGEAARYTADGAFNMPNASSPFTPINTSSHVSPGYAAAVDHPYYRRGVRLINGQILPGRYDWQTPANTRGFTVASENGVYVQGNYNASGISSVGTPTASENYLPQGRVVVNGVTTVAGTSDGANHIPASIVADAVTILSNYDPTSKNGWSDSKSFLNPYNIFSNRRRATETFTRFAMLSGDALSSLEATPNQGGDNPRQNGGVHNFKRFLEDWSGNVRLNYAGSLINLYNSRNNNGSFKVDEVTYSPPTRNWIFDSSFLDPGRLPPGTPYFQYVQTTGFQRTNN